MKEPEIVSCRCSTLATCEAFKLAQLPTILVSLVLEMVAPQTHRNIFSRTPRDHSKEVLTNIPLALSFPSEQKHHLLQRAHILNAPFRIESEDLDFFLVHMPMLRDKANQ